MESSLTRTAAPVLDKNETGVVTGFTLGVQRRLPWFPELAAPVLDGEWGILARVPAVLTPAPYADLDLGFVHQRWAFEVNTTRRSDHDARYRLTWGPAVSALAQPEAELTATTYGQQTGPAGLRALTPTSLTRLPLLVQTELRFKADAGHLAG